MTEVVRVTPEETYKKVESGKALLVCAYDDDAKFRSVQLKGALSFSELKAKFESLPKNQEIIFYCAWMQEHSAASLADEYIKKGYKNAKCLGGGVDAWKSAGYPAKSS